MIDLNKGIDKKNKLNKTKKNIIITTKKLTKMFGGLKAVDSINLDIYEGDITIIVGGNGAGKSTFIKMISGYLKPSSGEIYFNNEPLPLGDPASINKLGIGTIYQDLSLAELLDVPDNIFLGREKTRKVLGMNFINKIEERKESEKVLGRLGISIPSLDNKIKLLSGGQRQGVSIGRAIYWNVKMIIMDEPTAALGIHEKNQVKKLIMDLKSRGVSIIIISHEMNEVFEIGDRIIVFFQGRCIFAEDKDNTNVDEISKLIMTGKK